MGHWTRPRHFLFHAGVHHIRVVLLSANRVRDRYNVPTELWQLICMFFLGRIGRFPSLSPLCVLLLPRHSVPVPSIPGDPSKPKLEALVGLGVGDGVGDSVGAGVGLGVGDENNPNF